MDTDTNAGAATSGTVGADVLRDLLTAIRECEQERQTAQLSGLDTGWEHPCTQAMWRRVLFMADRVTQNEQVRRDSAAPERTL
jgi:hypothetical protein